MRHTGPCLERSAYLGWGGGGRVEGGDENNQNTKRRVVQEEAGCLSRASITEISTMQSKLGLFHLTFPGSSPSLQEAKAGTGTWKQKQEPRARN